MARYGTGQRMSADRERWHSARGLFDELVELDEDSRRERLRQLAQDDVALHEAVKQLLDADRSSEEALRDYSFGSRHATSAPATSSRDPLGIIGRPVSHFHVTGYVAAGGMGVVYAAEDLHLGRTVALKFPLPREQLDRAVQERSMHEARSVATLDHPNICTVYETGESEHGVFLAMPLYSGETLRERLDRTGPMSPADALEIVRQVTTGLVAAHDAGIVHRDLKPGNVMLLADGSVKILDFGLAKIRDVDLTKSRVALGTIAYMAPEQLRRLHVDGRADLWALGVMLYETLTGVLPFRGDHEVAVLHSVLHDEPKRPSVVNRALAPALDNLIGALMQKDPAARYHSSSALLADLEAVQVGWPSSGRAPFWSRSVQRRRIRGALVPAAALTLLAVGGGVAAIKLRANRNVVSMAGGAASPVLSWRGDTTDVGTVAALLVALDSTNTGRTVRLAPGTYDIAKPIVVPNGMTLLGSGIMQFDARGLPSDFTDATRTTIRMTASAEGSLVSLGLRSTVRGVEIVDLEGRSGNVIAVASRQPRDSIDATIIETIMVNANPITVAPSGAVSRGLWIATQNPNMGKEPGPHEGSVLKVMVSRSIVRSPSGGGGFFAYNFAANSKIRVELSRNVFGGSNEANGGVSRPDAVHDSEVHIVSDRNLYRNDWTDPCVSPETGWNFTGGSGAPIKIQLPAATRNALRVESTDDRLEGFTTGVLATGGRHFHSEQLNGAPTDNRIELRLIGTTISTPTCSGAQTASKGQNQGVPPTRGALTVADLSVTGAAAHRDELQPGDRNTVRIELRGVTGSGDRANSFHDERGLRDTLPEQFRGRGNRLEIVGDPETFQRMNRGLRPAPNPRFFTGQPAVSPP
ncbi:MAG TPA: serine/threonine-protein kinase [Gemmatimonas sp.]|nr:serine/threonine-protein kinase [Gemmatimonas sp.]